MKLKKLSSDNSFLAGVIILLSFSSSSIQTIPADTPSSYASISAVLTAAVVGTGVGAALNTYAAFSPERSALITGSAYVMSHFLSRYFYTWLFTRPAPSILYSRALNEWQKMISSPDLLMQDLIAPHVVLNYEWSTDLSIVTARIKSRVANVDPRWLHNPLGRAYGSERVVLQEYVKHMELILKRLVYFDRTLPSAFQRAENEQAALKEELKKREDKIKKIFAYLPPEIQKNFEGGKIKDPGTNFKNQFTSTIKWDGVVRDAQQKNTKAGLLESLSIFQDRNEYRRISFEIARLTSLIEEIESFISMLLEIQQIMEANLKLVKENSESELYKLFHGQIATLLPVAAVSGEDASPARPTVPSAAPIKKPQPARRSASVKAGRARNKQ